MNAETFKVEIEPESHVPLDLPTLRVRGALALVGVCTARPVGLFRAGGAVGDAQLRRLRKILRDLAETSLCRVVLIHHPPLTTEKHLKRLTDAAAFER